MGANGAVCAELNLERYKFVVQVVIGEQRGEGVRMGARCFWDDNTDGYAQEVFQNVRRPRPLRPSCAAAPAGRNTPAHDATVCTGPTLLRRCRVWDLFLLSRSVSGGCVCVVHGIHALITITAATSPRPH